MLAVIRKLSKSWLAAVLFGLLIVSFALWGINDVFRAQIGNDVVKAGSRVVTASDFQREYNEARKRQEEANGRPITLEIANANGLDRALLNSLATRESMAEIISRMGIRPADQLLVAQIQKIPAFFDQISGRFDRKTFDQRLAENGLDAERFDQALRDEMASAHFGAAVAAGLRTPRAYGAMAAIYAQESRDLAFFVVTPANVEKPPPATDAQLTAFLKQNAAQLTRPEMRVLTVVRFLPPAGAENAPIDPAELKKLYDFRKDTFSQPEMRTIVQIPAKTPAIAQQIVARLGRGEAPAAVAKAVGVDALTYDQKPRTAIADRRVGEAAFRMASGQVAPVQGELGQAVVKVVSVTPGRVVTMEEARPALEAELRKNAAAEKVYAQSQAYDEAHQGGASLTEAAQKSGAQLTTVGPVTAQGAGMDGQPVAGLVPQILQQAFGLPSGGESDLSEAGQGLFYAVRVERVIPPTLPPLAEVRAQLAQVYETRELYSRMQAKADELAARIRKGETFETVASSAKLGVARLPGLTRQNAEQVPQIPQEILGTALGARPGDVFITRPQQLVVVVGQVTNLKVEPNPLTALVADRSRFDMSMAMFRELSEYAPTTAQEKLKTRVDINKARAAIGMEPLATSTPSTKK